MTKLSSTLLIGVLLLCSTSSFSQNWQLAWSDEFTNSISPDWNIEVNGLGGHNNELQYYRAENLSIQNGELVITARKEDFGGKNYTSGRLNTQNKKFWKYGKIEARISMPSFSGSWPAFWMLGQYGGQWPACGEIDVMEHINGDNNAWATIHWADANGTHAQYTKTTQVNGGVANYHVYTIEWDANAIKWYIDGILYHSASIANQINNTGAFHSEFYLLLNYAIGGNWPGFNIDNGGLPASMKIDYVRVYQDASTVNKLPTVSITSPANNANYTPPASITLSADANDTDGSITKVDFYNGTTFLGSALTAPYSYTWTNVADGIYSITAKATDNKNAVTTSAAVSVKVSPPIPQGPFGGTIWPIPGIIQAESYDVGGQGVAYNDATPANQGNSTFRTDGVDIETCTDGANAIDVSYVVAGEWLEYSVHVTETDKYDITTRIAAPDAGMTFHIEMDGQNITGTIAVPKTGGWDTWNTLTLQDIALTAGNKIMRVVMETGNFNLNYFTFTKATTLGIDNNMIANNKLTYPNPTQGIIHIDDAAVKVEVYTMNGMLAGTFTPNDMHQIDISNLGANIYILKIQAANYSYYSKIVKQ